MKKTSIAIDEEIRKELDQYCAETGMQLSEAIRGFIRNGIAFYTKEKELGYKESIGPNGLMINQKYAIRASVEGTLILRKLATLMLKNENAIDEIDAEVSRIMRSGWQYDNQA